MLNNTITSRRLFILAFGSAGVCHAAKPLIDFDMSHGALIDAEKTFSLFGNQSNFNLTEDPYSLFDVEPDLTKNEAAAKFKKSKFYKPLIAVPSSYSKTKEGDLIKNGFKVVIYANQLIRATYPAVLNTAKSINFFVGVNLPL